MGTSTWWARSPSAGSPASRCGSRFSPDRHPAADVAAVFQVRDRGDLAGRERALVDSEDEVIRLGGDERAHVARRAQRDRDDAGVDLAVDGEAAAQDAALDVAARVVAEALAPEPV